MLRKRLLGMSSFNIYEFLKIKHIFVRKGNEKRHNHEMSPGVIKAFKNVLKLELTVLVKFNSIITSSIGCHCCENFVH